MKLYAAPASPFARKVRIFLLETGQSDDVAVEMIQVTPTAVNDDLNAANPLGKIPALVRDNEPAIYDSRVICRFLDARGDAGLYPESRLWEVLTLEATADAIMESAVLIIYEARLRPEDKQSQIWTDAQWAKIDRALAAIETRWLSHLSGPVDASHIAVGAALSYLDFRHDARNWRQGHDALAAWHAEFSKRPSMKATEPTS